MSGEVERFNRILVALADGVDADENAKKLLPLMKLLKPMTRILAHEIDDEAMRRICVGLRDTIIPFVLGEDVVEVLSPRALPEGQKLIPERASAPD